MPRPSPAPRIKLVHLGHKTQSYTPLEEIRLATVSISFLSQYELALASAEINVYIKNRDQKSKCSLFAPEIFKLDRIMSHSYNQVTII